MSNNKLLGALSVLIIVALALIASAQSKPTADPINIGWVGDKSGPTVSSQVPVLHALQAYFRMVNEAGGINGRPINMIEKDDGFNVARELEAVKSLISDDHVGLITGIGNSSGFASILPVLTANKVVGFGNQGTIKSNTYPFQPWIFQGNCNYADQADVALGYQLARFKLKSLNDVNVGVAGITVASGQEWIEAVSERVKKLGGNPIIQQLPTNLVSADVQAQAFVDAKVKFILLHTATGSVITFLRSMDKFGLRVPVAGSYSLGQSIVFTQSPYDVAKDVFAMNCVSPTTYKRASAGKIAVATGKKYGYPDAETEQANWALGWVHAQIIVEGLKNAKGDYSGPGIKRGLEKIKNLDTGGLSPKVTLSSKCHMALRQVRPYFYNFKKKELLPVGSYEQWAGYITNSQAAPGTCDRPRGK